MNTIKMDKFKDMKLIKKIGVVLLISTIMLYIILVIEFLKQ